MLNRSLKWVICLLIGIFLSIGIFSFADELPPVTIKASHGGTYPISSYAASHAAWNDHENRLNTANQVLQKLKYERDIINAGISKNREELRRLSTIIVLVGTKRIAMGAAVVPILELLDNGDMYELGLRRISKYAEIDSQNTKIESAARDREKFHEEYVTRWHHEMTHISSQVNGSPSGQANPVHKESIPMLGAGCKNACSIFWYDIRHREYYSGFSGGIPSLLAMIPSLARTDHLTTCKGSLSCGDDYWRCEGLESGGTARHQPRTCKIKGRKWNPDTTSYYIETCGMAYRNCDNPGGRCFNGQVVGNDKHTDNVSGFNGYAYISSPVSPSASLSGSSSAAAGGSVTVDVATTTPYSSVWWYVAGPGDSGLGTHVETDTGGSSSTTDSFTYTFSSDTTAGTWTITAYITNYSDSSVYQTSWTVDVSGSSYSNNDNTPDCSSCTDGCSSCDSSSGDSGSDDGDSGDSGNPGSSTPQWWCANSCGARLHSSRAHDAGTCSNCGHSYWSCYTSTVEYHTQTYTCARPGCGASFTECTNFLGSCIAAHLYHQKP